MDHSACVFSCTACLNKLFFSSGFYVKVRHLTTGFYMKVRHLTTGYWGFSELGYLQTNETSKLLPSLIIHEWSNVSIHPLCRSEPVKHDLIMAKHLLQQHQSKVITGQDEEDFQRIHVRRSHLFSDAMRAFSRATFNVSKMLKVVFVGEPSVDDGGLRREFFQLLMKEAFTASGLFVGWPKNVIPIHSVEAVAANKYYTVGKMIATCLVQGGQPPVCFAAAIADYLVYDEIRGETSLNDIPDFTVRQKLKKVCASPSNVG